MEFIKGLIGCFLGTSLGTLVAIFLLKSRFKSSPLMETVYEEKSVISTAKEKKKPKVFRRSEEIIAMEEYEQDQKTKPEREERNEGETFDIF